MYIKIVILKVFEGRMMFALANSATSSTGCEAQQSEGEQAEGSNEMYHQQRRRVAAQQLSVQQQHHQHQHHHQQQQQHSQKEKRRHR